jgi:hypothetical protein
VLEEIKSIKEFVEKRKTLTEELKTRRDLYKEILRHVKKEDEEQKAILESDIEMIEEFIKVSDREVERAEKKMGIVKRLKQKEIDIVKENARLAFEAQPDPFKEGTK